MNQERIFLVLSFLLLVVVGAAALTVTSASAMSRAGAPDSPLYLAPPMPTPTPAPLPPGYTPPEVTQESGDVEEQANGPDLIVEDIVVEPSSPYAFNKATIKVTIANIGDRPMMPDNNFYVDLYLGGSGVPGSGQRGLTCQSGTCAYPDSGYTIVDSVLPWGCQGFWVEGVGARYTLTATVVFSGVQSYYVYAQIDTPEEGFPLGHVFEKSPAGEYNNIYPNDSSERIQSKAPGRFTQSTHIDWFSDYASSLEVIPVTKVLTDINGVQVVSNAALEMGYWEEPPICWGTTDTLPSLHCPNYATDYNVLEPDTMINSLSLNRNQYNPVIATDGVTDSQNVVVVWEDQRTSTQYPDIYLRWSNSEADADGEYHYRQVWGAEVKVNDNVVASQQRNPAVAMSPDGDVVISWQDNRNDPDPSTSDMWDIYVQQYYLDGGGLTPVGVNQRVQTVICPDAVETKPDIAVDKTGTFYVVCQSMCTNQSAIWASKGRPPSPGAPISWDPWRYVADPNGHEKLDPKVDVSYTTVISDLIIIIIGEGPPPLYEYYYTTKELPVLSVVWHENRGLGTGDDIYVTYNLDQMASGFAVDARVNQDSETLWYSRVQDQPVIAVSQTKADMTVKARTNSGQLIEVNLENIPVPALQLAWRDYRNSVGGDPDPRFIGNDPDIYYAYAPFKLDETTYRLFLPTDGTGKVQVEKETKVNLHDTVWEQRPKQFDPCITVWTYPDFLSEDREIPYEVYVAWADTRNYDEGNCDIYHWHYGDAADGTRNFQLNDEAKIRNFDQSYLTDYTPDRPPPAWQQHPSIASNVGGDLRMVWEDNRYSVYAVDLNDIFFTRTPFELQDYGPIGGIGTRRVGAFVSKAFDSCPGLPEGSPDCSTNWFKIDYGGVTPEGTWIALQTRIGDTVAELLNAEWYPQDLAWDPDNAYWIPIRGYLGPGAYIVGPGGQWPEARYAQYRVNFWSFGSTPLLYYVTLFYGSASGQGVYGKVHLPAIFKNASN